MFVCVYAVYIYIHITDVQYTVITPPGVIPSASASESRRPHRTVSSRLVCLPPTRPRPLP